MSIQPLTSGGFFRSLSIFNLALILGIVLHAIFAWLVFRDRDVTFSSLTYGEQIAGAILLVILIGGMLSAQLLINRQRAELQKEPSLKAKLEGFRNMVARQYTVLAGAGTLAIMVVLFNGSGWFYVVTAACLLGLFLLRPTPERAVAILGLNAAEQAVVHDPGALLE